MILANENITYTIALLKRINEKKCTGTIGFKAKIPLNNHLIDETRENLICTHRKLHTVS